MIGTRQRLLLLFQYVDSANFLEFDHSELHWHCHECNSLALIRHKLEIYCKQMHHHCRLMWNRIRRLSQTHPTSPPPPPPILIWPFVGLNALKAIFSRICSFDRNVANADILDTLFRWLALTLHLHSCVHFVSLLFCRN